MSPVCGGEGAGGGARRGGVGPRVPKDASKDDRRCPIITPPSMGHGSRSHAFPGMWDYFLDGRLILVLFCQPGEVYSMDLQFPESTRTKWIAVQGGTESVPLHPDPRVLHLGLYDEEMLYRVA